MRYVKRSTLLTINFIYFVLYYLEQKNYIRKNLLSDVRSLSGLRTKMRVN
jgi:hypothetical protein